MIEPNGCGPHYLPDWARDDYFLMECNQHDIEYYMGVPQDISDKKFYEAMKERIRRDKSLNFWQRKYRYAQARFFYYVVRTFGFTSHKDGLDL